MDVQRYKIDSKRCYPHPFQSFSVAAEPKQCTNSAAYRGCKKNIFCKSILHLRASGDLELHRTRFTEPLYGVLKNVLKQFPIYFKRTLQHCLGVKLQKCFVDCELKSERITSCYRHVHYHDRRDGSRNTLFPEYTYCFIRADIVELMVTCQVWDR